MNESTPSPAQLWAQAFQTWAGAWSALAGQSAQGEGAPADPIQLWNQALDRWIEGWSAFFEETLHTPEAAAASGRMLDALLNLEKPLRERTAATMQYWLEFLNMPSRQDLIRVLSQLNEVNARLDELLDRVEDLSDRLAALERRRAAAPAAG
ncbi:MAG: hypothetical protein C4290_10095 [Chloroflexota bacterium]